MASSAILLSALSLPSWPHEWLEENRQPVFTFSPWGGDEYGFYLMSIPAWTELLLFMVLEMAVAALFAVPIYHTLVVVPQRSSQQKKNKLKVEDIDTPSSSSILSFLLTFGVFLPFWVFAPKAAVDALDLRQTMFRFCICVVTPTTSIYRILEAYYGFTPAHATRSAGEFALYFGFPITLRYGAASGFALDDDHDDKKKISQTYIKASSTQILTHLLRFLGFVFLTGIYQSMFRLNDTLPNLGVVRETTDEEYYAWRHVVDPLKWRDTAFYAILLQLYLATFGEGLIFVTSLLTGIQTEKMMMNPMFESTSPSDFWGRRWNLPIHSCLKGGIYKPVRSLGGTKAMAVLGTFLASGLQHEWLLPCTMPDHPHVFGRSSVFFAWQAMLVAAEYTFGRAVFVQSFTNALPVPVLSFLVILCGVPFGRWFLDSYVHSAFFAHGEILLFTILVQENR